MQHTLGSSCLEFINNLSKVMSKAFIMFLATTIILLTSSTAMGFTFPHQCIQLCPCLSIAFTPIMQCESSVLLRIFAFFILCSRCIVALASKAKNRNVMSKGLREAYPGGDLVVQGDVSVAKCWKTLNP